VAICNEAATLFVALARSTGLPARTVAGLIYMNGRFYYHAWAEVYLTDWVAVTPHSTNPRRRRTSADRHRGARATSRARPADRPAEARGTMIRLENLTKLYGSFVAVDDISLHVPRGVLFGCLGPNGAGKTTTLRMIAGILRPTQGRVLLGGDDVHINPLSAKMRLGFIPDRPFVYDKLTGAEFFRFVAGLYGQEGDSVERRIAELLEVFELTSWKDELVERTATGCGRS